MKDKTYIAIDLKSFYASVECRERGLDPLDTNLVVADESRTDKTICLAVTPSLKSYGMANPPFNQKEWRGDNELIDDPRWDGYEVPPTSNANYGWILNIVSKLSQNGVAGFLLANGALLRQSGASDTEA